MISFDDAWGKKVRRGEMGTGDIEEAVYDCVYLALCADRGAALATADARLRDAARDIHVKLWERDG